MLITEVGEWQHNLISPKADTGLAPPSIYLLKVNNVRCEISLKLTIKTPERRYWRRSWCLYC